MSYFTHEKYFNELQPLVEKIEKEVAKQKVSKSNAKKIHSDLVTFFTKLQNGSSLKGILAQTKVKDLLAFYKKFTSSTNPDDWDWEGWIYDLQDIRNDLEGDFVVRKGKTEEDKDTFLLNGSTLEIKRYINNSSKYDLEMKLHDVHSVVIKGGYRISVDVFDIFDKQIADFYEYVKTEEVAIVREDAYTYKYEFRRAKK